MHKAPNFSIICTISPCPTSFFFFGISHLTECEGVFRSGFLLLPWVFSAARGLCLVTASGGCSPDAVCGLLPAVAPLVAEHGPEVHGLQ